MIIDVSFETLGERWRVIGQMSPAVPARLGGPPERCSPGEPAEWYEFQVFVGDGNHDMSNLLELLCVPNPSKPAIEHILDMAELQWMHDRDAESWEAA